MSDKNQQPFGWGNLICHAIFIILEVCIQIVDIFREQYKNLQVPLFILIAIAAVFNALVALCQKKIIAAVVIFVTIILAGIAIYYSCIDPKFVSSSVEEGTEVHAENGNLEIHFDQLVFANGDAQHTGDLEESLDGGEVQLCSVADNKKYDYARFENNILYYEELPAGEYKFRAKFPNYDTYTVNFILNADALTNVGWIETASLCGEGDYKKVDFVVSDENNEPLSGEKVTIKIGNNEPIVVVLDENGQIEGGVNCEDDEEVTIAANRNGREYEQTVNLSKQPSVKEDGSQQDMQPTSQQQDSGEEDGTSETDGNEENDTERDDTGVVAENSEDLEQNENGQDEKAENEKEVHVKINFCLSSPELIDNWREKNEQDEEERQEKEKKYNARRLLSRQDAIDLNRDDFEKEPGERGCLTQENPEETLDFSVDMGDYYWFKLEHEDYSEETVTGEWKIAIEKENGKPYASFAASMDTEGVISKVFYLIKGDYRLRIYANGDGVFGKDYVLKAKKFNHRIGADDGNSERIAIYDMDVIDGNADSDKVGEQDGGDDAADIEGEAPVDDAADVEGETPADDVTDTQTDPAEQAGDVGIELSADKHKNRALKVADYVKADGVITYFGYVGEGETDKYPLRLDNAGAVAFKFEHTDLAEDKVYWLVEIKNDSGDIIASLKSKGKDIELLSSNLGLPAGDYSVEVRAKEKCDELYALSVVYHESRYWEHETDNDRKKNADILENGVGLNGSLSKKKDVDYYVFNCPESGTYDMILKYEEDCALCIEKFEEEDGKKLIMDLLLDESGARAIYSQEMEAGKAYYFKVKADEKWNRADYVLRVVGR